MVFIFITTWKQLRLELYALWLWSSHSAYRQSTEPGCSHFSHWIVKQILQWLRFSQDFKPRYTSTKQLPVGGWDSYSPYLSLTQKPEMQWKNCVDLTLCVFYTAAVGTQLYILHTSSGHIVSALLQQRDTIQRCDGNAERKERKLKKTACSLEGRTQGNRY